MKLDRARYNKGGSRRSGFSAKGSFHAFSMLALLAFSVAIKYHIVHGVQRGEVISHQAFSFGLLCRY